MYATIKKLTSKALPAVSALPSTAHTHSGISFTGNYLSKEWTRRFILGTLLQSYEPQTSEKGLKSDTGLVRSVTTRDTCVREESVAAVETGLLKLQRLLSETWGIPVKPLDRTSERRIFRLLARYACGEGVLSDECLDELNAVVGRIPGAPQRLEDLPNMEHLLQCVGYVKSGDNLRRVAYAGELHYAPQAHALIAPYRTQALGQNGGDPYDAIRTMHPGPAYAIDSATTSEVDDAVGVDIDPDTGESIFTVYISDATVYCPIDSPLEQLTARLLSTTTYLPERVFFMLPKSIVDAATLREHSSCRTFNVRFRVDPDSGELKNFSISLGWLQQLRRLTYDQVEQLLESHTEQWEGGERSKGEERTEQPAEGSPRPSPALQPPVWLTKADRHAFRCIYDAALVRFRARMARTASKHITSISNCLPDPLIMLEGLRVVSLRDQITCTQNARLAVSEMMIAANEVCSRIAQANKLSIPYRGTRPRSGEHELALAYTEPDGVQFMPSLDCSHTYTAELMQRSIKQLSSVTRAIYHHTPIYHVGLDTTYYTHSTSPLRRYADMLVHHQLKVWLWSQSQYSARFHPYQLVPEHSMATLCANISAKQEQASLLQDSTTRYWTLCYVEQLLHDQAGSGARMFMCLVGETRDVMASPEYSHFAPNFARGLAAMRSPEHRPSTEIKTTVCAAIEEQEPCDGQAESVAVGNFISQAAPEYRYVSELYLPQLQLAHTLHHNNAAVLVGAVVECQVTRVQPTQGVLELEVVTVREGKDERMLEKVCMSGFLSHLDS